MPYRMENPSPRALYMREWRARNPEYRARQVEAERRRKAREAAKEPCPVCGGEKWRKSVVCVKCFRGENHHAWKGGEWIDSDGYRHVYAPEEPGADKKGYIREHRLVMQHHIGRTLFPDETVHHKYGDRLDNQIEHLELWSGKQPKGQRVEDLVEWAKEIIERYDQEAEGW